MHNERAMAKCRFCGEETLLTVNGIPVCLKRKCDLAVVAEINAVTDPPTTGTEKGDLESRPAEEKTRHARP